jgi:hypothetical protein
MRPFLRVSAVVVVLGLSACAIRLSSDPNNPVNVPTNPNNYSIEPKRVAHLRAPQSVALKNAYPEEASARFPIPSATLVVEQKQLTETAIAMLGRALAKQGIASSEQAEKTITMCVRAVGWTAQPFRWTGKVILEAQLGDGAVISYPNEYLSGWSGERAFDGAVLFALNDLLADERFIAYMNGHQTASTTKAVGALGCKPTKAAPERTKEITASIASPSVLASAYPRQLTGEALVEHVRNAGKVNVMAPTDLVSIAFQRSNTFHIIYRSRNSPTGELQRGTYSFNPDRDQVCLRLIDGNNFVAGSPHSEWMADCFRVSQTDEKTYSLKTVKGDGGFSYRIP